MLFSLINYLSDVASLKIIIDNNNYQEDIRLVYDSSEMQTFLELNSIYKLNKVLEVLKDKAEIRRSKTNRVNYIIVDEQVFILSADSINEPTLGIISDARGYNILSLNDVNNSYQNIFEQAWANFSKDIKKDILDIYYKAIEYKTPDFLYKFTLNRIFQDKTLADIDEQRLTKTGFKNSLVWNMLYNFQRDAV